MKCFSHLELSVLMDTQQVLELRKALQDAKRHEAQGATAAAMREEKRTNELMEALAVMAALEAELEALADNAAHEAELEEVSLPSSSLLSPSKEANTNNGSDKNGKTPRPPSPPPGGPPSSSSSSMPRGSSSSSAARRRQPLLEAAGLAEVPQSRGLVTLALSSLRLLLTAFLGAAVIPRLAPGLVPARAAFLDALLQHFRSSATSVLMPVGVLVAAAPGGAPSSRWEWLSRWYRWSHGQGSRGGPAAYFADQGLSNTTSGIWGSWAAAWNDSGGSVLALCAAAAVAALVLAGTWAAASLLKSLVRHTQGPLPPDGSPTNAAPIKPSWIPPREVLMIETPSSDASLPPTACR